ncbi:hypothetical protein HCH_04542 [Hahella chejuensis KCTC 2396]|uniref:Lipoprotein n=1 Tax=Hahella chejuensis (strain KCTC 2396) TaxID=349521 RepID=Q2SDN2_HAHCH|nr:hypothetical protein [Hahella chejuensis]ABC31242.1 hypothetical protein HCH_04542 [Hahella chejuensis KCTC 2396]
MDVVRIVRGVVSSIMFSLVLSGCGPSTFVKTRVDFEPFQGDLTKKTDSGISIERYFLKNVPDEFYLPVQSCDRETQLPIVGIDGKPKLTNELAIPKDTMLEKVSITNNTGHVIRLNSVVITAFDPADNQYDMLDKGQLASYLMQERPCAGTDKLISHQGIIRLISKNTELLPNRTVTGYLIYKPFDMNIPGVWKLSFYEIPVKTNSAGVPTKTVNFEFRSVLKKYQDTYKREDLFSQPIKIATVEVR